MLNPKTGKYDGISSAYRIKLASAYVVDPDKPMDIPKLALDEDRKAAFEAIKLGHQGRRNPHAPAGAAGHQRSCGAGSWKDCWKTCPARTIS